MYESIQTTPNDVKNETIAVEDEEPAILEEIEVEELAIDGICGVY